jgi:AraC-like DNA-binding protein/quercetin dioxygenase-like cupin family protein
VICLNKTELTEYLVKDKPPDLDFDGNAGMLGSTINITSFENIPGSSVVITQHGRYLPTPEHGHNYYEMMYVYSGSITHYIGDDEVRLGEGSFCLFDQNIRHSIAASGKYDIAVNFIFLKKLFTPDFFTKIEENNLFYDFFTSTLYNRNTFGRYIVVDAKDNTVARDLAAIAMCESFDPDICSKGTLESLIPILLNELFRSWRNKGGRKILSEPDGASNVWRILRYIQTNCATVSLTSTAQRFGYAPNYLGTLLAKTTGQSFTEIRQKACINQATIMLVNSDMPIGEIAQSVGISNVTFFYTLFHRFFDMTPAEYRAKYRSAQ